MRHHCRKTVLPHSSRQSSRRLKTAAWVVGSLAPLAAHAQNGVSDTENADAMHLNAVEVSARAPDVYEPVAGYVAQRQRSATKTDTPLSETPQSVSVITADAIADREADSLANVFEYGAAGVGGAPFGFEPRYTFIRIRGFDVTDNALYRDGLKLVAPPVVAGSGTVVSYNLEPYGAERISVPKGPGSTLYGQAAPGGLVNYVSKRPTFTPLHEVGVAYGSHDRAQGQFDLGGPIGDSGRFAYRLTGLARGADTKIDYVSDDRIYVAPAATWRPNDRTELTVLAHYQKDKTRSSQAYPARGTLEANPNGPIPRSRFTGEPNVDRYERTTYAIGYEFSHAFDDHLTFRQNARYTSVDLDDISVYASSVVDDRTVGRGNFNNLGGLDSLVVDNQFEMRFATAGLQHTLLAGIDYQHADLDSFQSFQAAPDLDIYAPDYGADIDIDAATVYNDQHGTQSQTGVYLQDQVTVAERWIATLGGRYDRASRSTRDSAADIDSVQDDNAYTGRAALLYKSDIGLSPYVSYSEGFLPSLGADADGDAFEPETSHQYELGVKYLPDAYDLSLTLALFNLERENYVSYNTATFANEQVGAARSQGVEIEGNAQPTDGLNLSLAYAYVDAEITRSNNGNAGNRPQLSPEHQASLWADYTLQHGVLADLGFGAGVRYKDAIFGDNANTSEVPDVTLFDAAVHYDWHDIALALNARNIFDKRYVGASYARGGTFFATYGEARRVVGSVTYRW